VTRTRLAWNRLGFALRGGVRLNGREDENTARSFHLMLTCTLVWILLLLAVGVPFFAVRKTGGAIACVVLGLATLGSLYLVRAGRIHTASLFFLTTVWCTAEVFSALNGGLRSGVYGLVVLVIVNVGWLSGRSSAIGLAIATLLISLAEAVLEYSGHPLPLYFPGSPFGNWMIFAGILLFAVNPILAILDALKQQVAALRETAERLRESEEKFRTLFENASDAIFIMQDNRLIDCNVRALDMFGCRARDQIVGRHPYELSPRVQPNGRDSRESAIEKATAALAGQPQFFEWMHARLDGTPFPTEVGLNTLELGSTKLLQAIIRDVSERMRIEEERKKLHEQLIQAQRMESIGRLAGGVAHDFNNLLTVINGYSRLLLDTMSSGDPSRERLEQINRAGERAAGVTSQLLAFSRKQILQPRVLDCNRIIQEMQSMLTLLLGEDIELCVRFHEESPLVFVDPQLLEQLIMNLAVNARDAMPQGGKLLIETDVVECPENGAQSHPGGQVGPYVMLAMTDGGIGMDEETRRHIFEPFFTTKPVGKGTGLGLSMVHGFVEQSGGYIEVSSEPGRGTTFRTYLPRVGESPDAGGESEGIPVPTMGKQETVLVVEDQAEVRRFTTDSLRLYGYRVIPAESASEALALCEQERGGIDLVLTDVVMPNLGGTQLADLLAKHWPGIKVLFMSGHADDAIMHHGALQEGAELIQKPFGPDQLAIRVRKMLAARDRVARIVVADDEAEVRKFLRMVLEGAGYEVIEAANGKEAIREVRAGRVDMLITDLVMPEQEGIETIIALHKEAARIQLIAISGAFGGEFLRVARRLGVQAVFSKPVDKNLLLAKVAELLKSRR
jgi:PAS domain S-box-containing protein